MRRRPLLLFAALLLLAAVTPGLRGAPQEGSETAAPPATVGERTQAGGGAQSGEAQTARAVLARSGTGRAPARATACSTAPPPRATAARWCRC